MYSIFKICISLLIVSISLNASLLPNKNNQIIVYFNKVLKQPSFYIIFSSKKIKYDTISLEELKRLQSSKNESIVAIRVGYKDAVNKKGNKFSYFFGNKHDTNQPWNNGQTFSYKSWKNYSPDIWDNIAVVYTNDKHIEKLKMEHIVVRRGSQLILDTRKNRSFLTKKKFRIKHEQTRFKKLSNEYKVLDVSSALRKFSKVYYEIKGPILISAINDLGQSESKKYSNISRNWCSEFIAYVYEPYQSGLPNPNTTDIYFEVLRPYFNEYGKVYSFYEVKSWSIKKRMKLIPPGSYVSFHLDNKSQHSALLVKWFNPKDKGIPLSFAAISGNNREVVYFHKAIDIKNKFFEKRDENKIYFDDRSFFGVMIK